MFYFWKLNHPSTRWPTVWVPLVHNIHFLSNFLFSSPIVPQPWNRVPGSANTGGWDLSELHGYRKPCSCLQLADPTAPTGEDGRSASQFFVAAPRNLRLHCLQHTREEDQAVYSEEEQRFDCIQGCYVLAFAALDIYIDLHFFFTLFFPQAFDTMSSKKEFVTFMDKSTDGRSCFWREKNSTHIFMIITQS